MGGKQSVPDLEANRALITAVIRNDIAAAQLALKSHNASDNTEVPEELFASLTPERSQGNSVLHACAFKSSLILIDLLDKGANVNAVNSRLETPLHLAAEAGKNLSVEALLKRGSTTQKVDLLNRTALHRAVTSDHVRILETLNLHAADLDARDDYGSTPLHYAVAFGSPNAMKWLLKKNVNLNLKNSWRQTPGDIAIKLGYDKDVVNLLFGRSTEVDSPIKIPPVVEQITAMWKKHQDSLKDRCLGPITLKQEVPREVWGDDVRSNTPLHLAAVRRKHRMLKELLSLGANPADLNSRGETPIHISAQLGEDQCCKDLLQYNSALVNAVDHIGQTPLHKAIVNGRRTTLDLLKLFGANIDASDNEERTPLHLAVLLARGELLQWFRDNGANFTSRTQSGNTAADLARSLKWSKESIAFLEHKDDLHDLSDLSEPPEVPTCGLLQAVVLGNAKVVHDHLPSANLAEAVPRDMPNFRTLRTIEGNYLLHLAAMKSSPFVRKLLRHHADVRARNASGEVPLHLAAEAGLYRCAELLLEKNNDTEIIDNVGRTPLHRAVMNNQILVLETLKKYNCDLNAADEHGSTPLHYAAAYACSEAFQWLKENEADLTCQNSWGQTPEDLARETGSNLLVPGQEASESVVEESVFALLLKFMWLGRIDLLSEDWFKKDLLQKEVPRELWGEDVRGNTLLHYAAAHRQPPLVQLLLKFGAKPNAKNYQGETPAHLSAKFGMNGCCHVLLRHFQALVFERDSQGQTPLHKAVLSDQCSTLVLLKEYGSDINAKDDEGKTALHVAALLAKEDAVKWCIENGADTSIRTGLGYLASQLAENAGMSSVAEMLRKSENCSSQKMASGCSHASHRPKETFGAEEDHDISAHSLSGKELLDLPD